MVFEGSKEVSNALIDFGFVDRLEYRGRLFIMYGYAEE
jgi:hypothetical protein